MEMLLIIFIALAIVIVLDIAALLWGYDSRDRENGAEWERRRAKDFPVQFHHHL